MTNDELIIKACFADRDVFMTAVGAGIMPGDFDDFRLNLIFDAMEICIRTKRPVDLISVIEVLEKVELLEDAGGAFYIKDLLK